MERPPSKPPTTPQPPPTITTSSTAKGIIFQAGTGFDSTTLFQVKAADGTPIFTVDTTTQAVSLIGLNVSGGLTLSGTSHLIGNGDTRGQVTIPAGATSANYSFTAAYGVAPNVVVSPTGTLLNTPYTVTSVSATGFTVTIGAAQGADTTFNFQVQQ